MVIYVGGAKGGTGKSLVSMLALHHFLNKNEKPILIDADTDNPDVYLVYKDKGCEGYPTNMDNEAGWAAILNFINNEKESGRPIIINSGARNTKSIISRGAVLNKLNVNLVSLWVINHQKDGLLLLKEFLTHVHYPVCVVKNGYFGGELDFSVFDNSAFKKNGMPSVYIPAAADWTTHALYVERKAFHELPKYLNFGENLLAEMWLENTMKTFETALKQAAVYKVEVKNE